MSNEEIILERMKSRYLGKSPIKFSINKEAYYDTIYYNGALRNLENEIEELESIRSVIGRVDKIISLAEDYRTYTEKGKFQCYAGNRRSTLDIWRIYKYYFGEIDVFTIMRALYALVVDNDLNTYRCPDIRKRVFWYENSYDEQDKDVEAELGVPLREWENIGLNNG